MFVNGLTDPNLGEKLRKRLEDLEILAAAVAQSKSQQPLPLASPPRETASPPAPSNTISLSTGDKNTQVASAKTINHVTPQSPLSDVILNDWIALDGDVTAQSRDLSTTTALNHNHNNSNNQQLEKSNKDTSAIDSWGWDLHLWDASAFFAPHQQTYTRQNESWASDSEEQQHYNTPFGFGCNCADRKDGLHPRFYTISSSNSSSTSSSTSSSDSHNNNCKAHRILSNSQSRGASLRQPSPDPWASNIRVEMICNISAMWTNCLHVGISDPVFCDDDSISFFYRAPPLRSSSSSINMIQNSDNHHLIPTTSYTYNNDADSDKQAEEARVRTVQSIFKTLKPDLRPIKEQITHIHHPVIDCLPFPTLRRNILLSLANNTFDEDEMCEDLLVGLICWGRAGGGAVSRRDLNTSTGKAPANSGTPWDSRSWQAKPWFLRKYWVLLGGEEGELARQSEWWRNVRGEEEDIWACA